MSMEKEAQNATQLLSGIAQTFVGGSLGIVGTVLDHAGNSIEHLIRNTFDDRLRERIAEMAEKNKEACMNGDKSKQCMVKSLYNETL